MAKTSLKNGSGLDIDDIQEAEVISQPDREAEAADEYRGKVKVVNMLTGEIMEREYGSVVEMVDLYKEIEGTQKAAKKAMDKLMAQIKMFMTTRDNYQLANGMEVKWVNPQKRIYSFEKLVSRLDQDALAMIAQVSKKDIETLLDEMQDSGELTRDEKESIMGECSEMIPSAPHIKIVG